MNLFDCVENGLGAELFVLCSTRATHMARERRNRMSQALIQIEPTFTCSDDIVEVLDSEDCKGLIAALGVGIQLPGVSDRSLSREFLRYGKIIVVTEPGEDVLRMLHHVHLFFQTYIPFIASEGFLLVCDSIRPGATSDEFCVQVLDPETRRVSILTSL